MARYKRLPAEIDAVQWTGENQREMFDFLENGCSKDQYMNASGDNFYIDHSRVAGGLMINTLESPHEASLGDFIIKGTKGEFYPCKPDIFPNLYEKV